MEKRFIELYHVTKEYSKQFRKKTYLSDIDKLQEDYKELLKEIRLLMDQNDACLSNLQDALIADAKADVDQFESRRKREIQVLNNNMALVSYFLPLIRAIKSPYADEFAQQITEKWNETFTSTTIGCPSVSDIQGGFKTGFCYVTTAVCQSQNKPDDCYELTLLRHYRDTYMMETPEREQIVKEYYNIAPTIVKHISQTDRADEIYEQIWEEYLQPCIRLIEAKEPDSCEELYTKMVRTLEKKYLYQ